MSDMNVVGYPLSEAVALLTANSIVSEVVRTVPPNCRTVLLEDCWYVLRQTFLLPTSCQLIIAAKIRPTYFPPSEFLPN
jgi:hypothetical protein